MRQTTLFPAGFKPRILLPARECAIKFVRGKFLGKKFIERADRIGQRRQGHAGGESKTKPAAAFRAH